MVGVWIVGNCNLLAADTIKSKAFFKILDFVGAGAGVDTGVVTGCGFVSAAVGVGKFLKTFGPAILAIAAAIKVLTGIQAAYNLVLE